MVAQALCRSITQVVYSVQLRLVLHGRRLGRRSATSRSPGSKSQQQAFLTFALKASRFVLIRPGRISSFFAMRTALSTLTARWCECSSIDEGSLLFWLHRSHRMLCNLVVRIMQPVPKREGGRYASHGLFSFFGRTCQHGVMIASPIYGTLIYCEWSCWHVGWTTWLMRALCVPFRVLLHKDAQTESGSFLIALASVCRFVRAAKSVHLLPQVSQIV